MRECLLQETVPGWDGLVVNNQTAQAPRRSGAPTQQLSWGIRWWRIFEGNLAPRGSPPAKKRKGVSTRSNPDDMFVIPAEEAKKHIEPPRLAALIVSPSQSTVELGKKQTFTAK